VATWELAVRAKATPLEVAPVIDWLRRLPDTTLAIRGPNDEGIVQLSISGPIMIADDVESILGRWIVEQPGVEWLDPKDWEPPA